MNTFQWIAVGACALLLGLTLLLWKRHILKPLVAVFWALIWISAAALIVAPDLTGLLAQAVGIGRGADLLFYVAILIGSAGFLLLYLKLRRIEHDLTLLSREIALLIGDGRRAEEPPSTGSLDSRSLRE
jgi:small membrane protein